MAYDQASFLAGVAAGRNMQSWPTLKKGLGFFAFTLIGDVVRLFTRFKGIIDWGDGNTSEVDTSNARESDDAELRINWTYRDGLNEHQVIMVGDLYRIFFHRDTTSYASWVRSIDLPLPAYPQSGRGLFYISLAHLLDGCTGLTSVPDNFLDNLGAPGIYVSDISYLFYHSGVAALQEDLFERVKFYAPGGLVSARSAFAECLEREAIPQKLFDNPTVNQIGDVQGLFQANRKLLEVPQGLLDKCTAITNAESVFSTISSYYIQSTSLTTVPSGLFAHCPDVSNFRYAFYGNSKITSAVPELWTSHPSAVHTGCFRDCTRAANYNSIPEGWR